MSARIAEMVGMVAELALALYAAFRSKRDTTGAAHALGALAGLTVVASLALVAVGWLMSGHGTVRVNVAIAVAVGVGLWFATQVWRGSTWALITFAAFGVIGMASLLAWRGVGSGDIGTLFGTITWLSVCLATWNIVKGRFGRPPPVRPDA